MNEINVMTKDSPGDYDAVQTAKPGEPLFPIQGGDPLGPKTVQFWADEARLMARSILRGGEDNPEYAPSDADKKAAHNWLNKAMQAEQVGWIMIEYQRGEHAKEGTNHRYNDDSIKKLSEEADTALKIRKAMIASVTVLNNSIAGINDTVSALAEHQIHPEAEVMLREAHELVRQATLLIEPRRGNARS